MFCAHVCEVKSSMGWLMWKHNHLNNHPDYWTTWTTEDTYDCVWNLTQKIQMETLLPLTAAEIQSLILHPEDLLLLGCEVSQQAASPPGTGTALPWRGWYADPSAVTWPKPKPEEEFLSSRNPDPQQTYLIEIVERGRTLLKLIP